MTTSRRRPLWEDAERYELEPMLERLNILIAANWRLLHMYRYNADFGHDEFARLQAARTKRDLILLLYIRRAGRRERVKA